MKILYFITDLIRLVRFFIGGVFFLVICFILFIGVLVGQDVIIQTSEYGWPFALSLLALSIAAYYTWYTSRLITYTKTLELRIQWLQDRYARHIPRLLAINLMGIIQMAHINTGFDLFLLPKGSYFIYNILLLLPFVVFVNFLYIKLVRRFSKAALQRWMIIAICILFFTLLCTGIILTMSECLVFSPIVSGITILLIFLLQILAIHFFVYRGKSMVEREDVIWKWKIPYAEKYYFFGLNIVGLISFVFYILLWFNGPATFTGSFAIALFAISLLIGIINFITFINTLKGINLTVFILLWAVIVGFIWDKYQVNLIAAEDATPLKERPDITTYLNKWLEHRKNILDTMPDGKFNAYFVIAEGGGSRSGYWTSSVLSCLADATYLDSRPFSDHLIALSGASGGSQGNATFYSVLKHNDTLSNKVRYDEHCKRFSKSDFLSLALARFLCFDIYSHLFPFIAKKDRAIALENSYETIYGKDSDTLVSYYFAQPISRVYDDGGHLPFFFMTTTRVKDARPTIMSSVKLPGNYYCVDLLDSIDKRDIKLSTGVALSSRFPYVMPAGNIDNNYYVDGGYYDNYGSTAAGILYQEIKRIMNDSMPRSPEKDMIRKYLKKLHFSIIHITNSVDKRKREHMHPLVNDLAVPIKSIYSVKHSSTEYLVESLKKNFLLDGNDTVNIFIKEEIPMNLVISDYYISKMDEQLEEIVINNKDLKSKMRINRFNMSRKSRASCLCSE